jgi:hypothetical protein
MGIASCGYSTEDWYSPLHALTGILIGRDVSESTSDTSWVQGDPEQSIIVDCGGPKLQPGCVKNARATTKSTRLFIVVAHHQRVKSCCGVAKTPAGDRARGGKRGRDWFVYGAGNRHAISSSMNPTAGWNPPNQLVASVTDWLAFPGRPSRRRGKGVRNRLPERPMGCFAQTVPDTFSAQDLLPFRARTSLRRTVILVRCSPALGLIPSCSKER